MSDIFINMTILTSYILIVAQLVKEKSIFESQSLTTKILNGIGTGILGVILLNYTVHISPTVIMDLRHLAIVLATMAGGIVPAIMTAIIIAIGRVSMFGFHTASIVGVINIFVIGIGCGIIYKLVSHNLRRWIYLNTISILSTSISFIFLKTSIPFIVYFWMVSIIGGIIVAYSTHYVHSSNENYRKLKAQSTIDFLTGLNNVRQFDSALNLYIAKAKEHGEKLSLLFIDIDLFKKVNDTYGHLVGDEVLKQLGVILCSCSRSFDLVSRNGGEEFSVLLLNCTHNQALEIGERIRHEVEKHEFILSDGNQIHVTISIGLSTYMETTQCSDELLKQADDSLYKAKRTGRNKVCSVATL